MNNLVQVAAPNGQQEIAGHLFACYTGFMKFLRSLFVFLLLENIFVFFWSLIYGFNHHWAWIVSLSQLLSSYCFSEIVHTMFRKPKLPHPTSLAFQKIVNRYKV